MSRAKFPLIFSACLFAAWLGFLLFLVIESRTVVLSKPQFLIAQLYVVAEVKDDRGKPSPDVAIRVLWAQDKADETLKEMTIADLPECGKKQGYHGPGSYLIPVLKLRNRSFAVAAVPQLDAKIPADDRRIYPWTPDVQKQVEELVAAKNRE